MTVAPLLASPVATANYFRQFLAERHIPASRIYQVQFGPSVLTVHFHGFADEDAYGHALQPATAATAEASPFAIHVIDGAACGLPRPRLAWKPSDFGRKRTVRGWSDSRRTTYLLPEERGLAIADWCVGQAMVWIPGSDVVPWYERAAPFRWLFDNLATRLEMSTLHAAIIGMKGRGVLLAGQGGTGKSTLALAALGRGLDFVSDDYCLLSQQGGRAVAYPLYRSAKWKVDASVTAGWLQDIRPDAIDRTQMKNILHVDVARPGQPVSQLSVEAIIAPAIAPNQTTSARLEPISGQTALRFLAASTIAQSEGDGESLVRSLGDLARSIPAYRLLMPRDPDASVAAIDELLAERAGAAG